MKDHCGEHQQEKLLWLLLMAQLLAAAAVAAVTAAVPGCACCYLMLLLFWRLVGVLATRCCSGYLTHNNMSGDVSSVTAERRPQDLAILTSRLATHEVGCAS